MQNMSFRLSDVLDYIYCCVSVVYTLMLKEFSLTCTVLMII